MIEQKIWNSRVKEVRENAHLSREELAKQLNISSQVLANIEVGRTKLEANLLQKICQIVGITVDDFFKNSNSLVTREQALREADPKHIVTRYYSLNEGNQSHVDNIISEYKNIENQRKEADEIYLAAASGSDGLSREDLEDDVQMLLNMEENSCIKS